MSSRTVTRQCFKELSSRGSVGRFSLFVALTRYAFELADSSGWYLHFASSYEDALCRVGDDKGCLGMEANEALSGVRLRRDRPATGLHLSVSFSSASGVELALTRSPTLIAFDCEAGGYHSLRM